MKRTPRLERALEALAKERKLVQRDLAEVTMRRSTVTQAMERLERCRDSVSRTDLFDRGGRLRTDVYFVARAAEARMTEELGELRKRLERFDAEVTHPVQERLRRAAVRERAVETVVQKRRAEAERQEAEQERKRLDEHAQHVWRRGRLDDRD
ncbi:MAG: hypothetical protein AAFU79_19685 [Myxococcota bacterium]